jgi:hypothetical protein
MLNAVEGTLARHLSTATITSTLFPQGYGKHWVMAQLVMVIEIS